ncbi:MAG: hypothetical protein AAB396_00675 [Patescibacteria group bacterium]
MLKIEKHKKKIEITENESKDEIIWQIPEYEYNQKDISWNWLVLIVAIILFAFAVWQKNFLFAVFIVVAFLMINFMSNRFPSIWQFKMTGRGIIISLPTGEWKKFYSFEDMESFDIHSIAYDAEGNDVGEYKELILKLKSKFSPYLKINIYPTDEEKIKNFLLNFISHQEHKQSLTDSLARLIKF